MYTFTSRNGIVDLVQCPLSIDNEHQIKFNSVAEQAIYFENLHGTTVSPLNLIAFNALDYIEIPLEYTRVENKNYCRIQNYNVLNDNNVGSKWYYFFITKFEMVSDSVTRLYLKIDVWQTYQFDITFNSTFVERNHVQEDYYNSLNDEPSEGVLTLHNELLEQFSGGYFIFCNGDISQDDMTSSQKVQFKIGNFSIPSYVMFYTEANAGQMATDMQSIANAGRGDRVNSAMYIPFLADSSKLSSQIVNTFPYCSGATDSDGLLKKVIEFDFSTYIPQFKKELCFPYAVIQVQDMTTGQTINLEPNRFDLSEGLKAKFELRGSISETPSYKVIPMNYKNNIYSFSDSLVVKCNTSLPVLNNSYAKYLMNNQDFNNLKIAGGIADVGYSLLNKSPMGAFSGFESIANVMLQESQARKQPNQLTSITDGAMDRILFNNGIRIKLLTMDDDHKEMARSYWNMYGYPIKKLRYPSSTIDTGKTHKFIKTLDCNVDGYISQEYLQEITNLYNRGITFWKSDSFRQY